MISASALQFQGVLIPSTRSSLEQTFWASGEKSDNHVEVRKNLEQVISLNRLPDPAYRLRQSIPVRIQWDDVAKCYVAYDDIFDWYGMGDTPGDALAQLSEVILEDYLDLNELEDSLAPELTEKLTQMRSYVLDNGGQN